VYFRAREGEYAIPVEHVREVRPADALVRLPDARHDVAGLLPWQPEALTVLAPLGATGRHVMLLSHEGRSFGVLVDAVTGVAPPQGPIGPPPHGQDNELVAGVITNGDRLVLVIDVAALQQRLLV
jgi:purine-binding chemotaxis protein CheW